ncbi:hypothetical protein BJ165DRAFT_1504064 [Panaeolus papilionaceus]|nr:hypothetical protein BJ165DRAFT_1504064 [Panaeolus papilionaceus]
MRDLNGRKRRRLEIGVMRIGKGPTFTSTMIPALRKYDQGGGQDHGLPDEVKKHDHIPVQASNRSKKLHE